MFLLVNKIRIHIVSSAKSERYTGALETGRVALKGTLEGGGIVADESGKCRDESGNDGLRIFHAPMGSSRTAKGVS